MQSSSRKRDWIRKASAKQNLAFRSFSRFKVFVPWGPPAFPCRTSWQSLYKNRHGGSHDAQSDVWIANCSLVPFGLRMLLKVAFLEGFTCAKFGMEVSP